MLLGVIAGLVFCVLGSYCWIALFLRIQAVWREELGSALAAAIVLPLTGLAFLAVWAAENLSLNRGRFTELLERLRGWLYNSLLVAGGAFFLGFGLLVISDVLSAETMSTLIFGSLFVVGAFTALRRHRRWRQWLISHNHRTIARFYLLAVPTMVAVGCLILAYGL
jgi:hypothetical protein